MAKENSGGCHRSEVTGGLSEQGTEKSKVKKKKVKRKEGRTQHLHKYNRMSGSESQKVCQVKRKSRLGVGSAGSVCPACMGPWDSL